MSDHGSWEAEAAEFERYGMASAEFLTPATPPTPPGPTPT